MNLTTVLGLIIILVSILVWLGFSIKPAQFPEFHQKPGEISYVALPGGLPKPVDRYYRLVYGDSIPVITSAVVTGRAKLRPFGPFFLPARFRFTHVAGKDYRHYIETTFFNIPIMKVNERYIDGSARMELPFGTDEGERLDQAANLGLWAETAWFPAVFLTTPGVRWEAVDNDSAILVVPFKDGTDSFTVRFDSETGFPVTFEAMRYHDSKSFEKVLWVNRFLDFQSGNGKAFFTTGSARWMDQNSPWAYFTVESIIFNADVTSYVRQKGL